MQATMRQMRRPLPPDPLIKTFAAADNVPDGAGGKDTRRAGRDAGLIPGRCPEEGLTPGDSGMPGDSHKLRLSCRISCHSSPGLGVLRPPVHVLWVALAHPLSSATWRSHQEVWVPQEAQVITISIAQRRDLDQRPRALGLHPATAYPRRRLRRQIWPPWKAVTLGIIAVPALTFPRGGPYSEVAAGEARTKNDVPWFASVTA